MKKRPDCSVFWSKNRQSKYIGMRKGNKNYYKNIFTTLKRIQIGLIITVLFSCKSTSTHCSKNGFHFANNDYRIDKIDSINNWYLFYASRQDSLFKIVIEKGDGAKKCKQKVKVGGVYNLLLESILNKPLIIDGKKIVVMNPMDVSCRSFDEQTYICIDPKKGIYDLYYTKNIVDRCYVK